MTSIPSPYVEISTSYSRLVCVHFDRKIVYLSIPHHVNEGMVHVVVTPSSFDGKETEQGRGLYYSCVPVYSLIRSTCYCAHSVSEGARPCWTPEHRTAAGGDGRTQDCLDALHYSWRRVWVPRNHHAHQHLMTDCSQGLDSRYPSSF